MPTPENLLKWVIMGSAFALVLSIYLVCVLIWSRRRAQRTETIQRRLDAMFEPHARQGRVLRLWRDGQEATTVVPGERRHVSIMARLEEMRQIAAFQSPLISLILGTVAIAALAALTVLGLTGSFIVAPCASLAALLICWIYFKQRVQRRVSVYETQLIDALDLAARSLRAGHPLSGSFRLISEEIPAPVGTVFAEICQQQNLGVALDEALHKAADASFSTDLKLFVTSVIIQMRSGGNLADMMERLSFVIRDRQRLSRRITVLTAQTQFSKRVLLALPLLVFVVLNVLNRDYMIPLYATSQGQILLVISAAGLLLGAWVMNRLAVIRY